MHIIIALLGAIAGAGYALYFFINAAQQGGESVRDARGLWRAGRWSRRVGKRLIENLDDPREAAAVMMYQLAAYDGAVTEGQKKAMIVEMRRAFSADEEAAEGLYAFARMAVGEVEDAGNALRKLTDPINAACDVGEKRDFIAMLNAVAIVEGPISDKQSRLIAEAERRLLAA